MNQFHKIALAIAKLVYINTVNELSNKVVTASIKPEIAKIKERYINGEISKAEKERLIEDLVLKSILRGYEELSHTDQENLGSLTESLRHKLD